MGLILAAASFLFTVFLGHNDRYWEGFAHCGIVVGLLHFLAYMVRTMKLTEIAALCAIIAAVVTHFYSSPAILPLPSPVPVVKPHLPLLPRRGAGDTQAFVETSDGVGPGGVEVVSDLPPEYRKRNIASKGLGCCVFRSIDHAAHYQGVEELWGMPEWMVKSGVPGGGYPEKVDQLIPKMGGAGVEYVQHTGGDAAFLERALATGRMVCVTYNGHCPRYGLNTGIAHMVNLVYLDAENAAILDNNFIGKYLWMSRDEFLTRWKGKGGGWAVVLLAPPAPQSPHN